MISKIAYGALMGMLVLAATTSSARGDDGCCPGPQGRGLYVGFFGGGGCQTISNFTQVGTALFPPASGGPLNVNATATGTGQGAWLGGVQLGHEWSGWGQGNSWSVLPAAEFEGFYLGGTQRADVSDPNNRLNGHVFADTFPMNNGVFLTNAVFSLRTSSRVTPYVGGGIGAACIAIRGADSPQIVPPEPGINHFNSNPDSSAWGFAAQAKIGLRIALGQRAYVFTEYRFLYVGATTQTFGSTQYPTHDPTTPWTVHLGDMSNHLAVGGIGFHF